MKRVNQMRLYRLGHLNKLRALKVGGRAQEQPTIAEASIQLQMFAETEDGAAAKKAQQLCDELQRVYRSNDEINRDTIEWIITLLRAFETSLEDDLGRLPTYVVEPVAAYSFDQLINAAESVFTETMRKELLPQVILDFRSAGACLAFDLSTACGFHVCRAVDAMLQEYCSHFNAILDGSGKDWGKYIAALRGVLASQTQTKKPNARTVELLDRIRAIDRNPLVHPELNLDSAGALVMFDLCKNAVSLMALDIRNSP